jgi:hypothetical protein
LQDSISNSKADFLNLVKCIENRTQIRKMQTQFCWITGEKHCNFRKACP